MKAIICEMCGSQDLVKQDGFYVCQNCGTKYDPEEAKKLLVEITVDNSDKVRNLYQVARQAKDSNDFENAAKYYDLVLQEDPNSWEAFFYSVYFRAMQTRIAFIANAANSVSNAIPTVFSLILKATSDPQIQRQYANEICTRVKILGTLLESSARKTYSDSIESVLGKFDNGGQMITQYADEYFSRYVAVLTLYQNLGFAFESSFPSDNEMYSYAVDIWKAELQLFANYYLYFDSQLVTNRTKIDNLISKIRVREPYYQMPTPNMTGYHWTVVKIMEDRQKKQNHSYSNNSSSSSSGGGCYVATAVYGSYDCPQVWTLRRYRDYTLAGTLYGRAFIYTYYAISPTLVKWFGETEWFKNMWKPKLDKMVKRLNMKGVADTPYQDRNW